MHIRNDSKNAYDVTSMWKARCIQLYEGFKKSRSTLLLFIDATGSGQTYDWHVCYGDHTMKLDEIKPVERRTGTYAAVKYDYDTLMMLNQWLVINNIPNQVSMNDIHSTLIYSRKQIPSVYQVNMDSSKLNSLGLSFDPLEFAIFGKEGERVLVLKLYAVELVNLHKTLIEIGATHDYDSYEPHVTLSYDLPNDFDWEILQLPLFGFIPASINYEPLDLDWKES